MPETKVVRQDCFDYKVVFSDKYGFGIQSRYVDGTIAEEWVDVECAPKQALLLALADIFNVHLEDDVPKAEAACSFPQCYIPCKLCK